MPRLKYLFGGEYMLGIGIILLGIIFLVGNIYPDINIWRFIGRLWPVVLIVLGVYVIRGRGRRGTGGKFRYDRDKIIGDARLEYAGREIGETGASLVLGDLSVDLRGGRLKPGVNHVSISTIIGDTTIYVPCSFPLKFSGRTIVGDLRVDRQTEQGVLPAIEHADEVYEEADGRLLVTFSGIIGDMTLLRT